MNLLETYLKELTEKRRLFLQRDWLFDPATHLPLKP